MDTNTLQKKITLLKNIFSKKEAAINTDYLTITLSYEEDILLAYVALKDLPCVRQPSILKDSKSIKTFVDNVIAIEEGISCSNNSCTFSLDSFVKEVGKHVEVIKTVSDDSFTELTLKHLTIAIGTVNSGVEVFTQITKNWDDDAPSLVIDSELKGREYIKNIILVENTLEKLLNR